MLFVYFAPWLLAVVLAYDALLAAAAIADFLTSPRPETFLSVERRVDEKLSLGLRQPVVVELRSRGNRAVEVIARDEPPDRFTLEGQTQQNVVVPPGNIPAQFSYYVQAHAKGDYVFGDVFVQYLGALGLVARMSRLPAPQSVKVYPNMLEMAKYEMLARRGRLMQLGIRSAKVRGGGSEFESLREYVTGDEYKKIDWSATARRGKLISRQYEAERSQNVVLLLDTGRTMLQPIQKMAKLDFVVNTALMLAYVAVSSDDKVGLMAFDAEVRTFLPPAKSNAQVYQIMERLYNLEARLVETDYQAAFQELATRWRRRSLIVLFSDLVDPDSSSQILNAVSILEERHRVVCVTVSDPNIIAAAAAVPEESHQVYTKAVATQVLHERRQAIQALKRRGVWTVDSTPENLSADLINRYLELKAKSLI
ncbi:hypothetical protein CCAX7_49230 [Capsulimonas corticalis]|uniref:DUF58 domain-containing protein n=1 Tax=Capsulimonas corticalis TaxID=2219043 RepID=A0A402CPV8_9BACT|nr:DUF58 domain-containing protein [Capsulimonas corticalis]BDI32872.1 hypothetical protein CCAX7_49230 [Capsulimonas corticalis]